MTPALDGRTVEEGRDPAALRRQGRGADRGTCRNSIAMTAQGSPMERGKAMTLAPVSSISDGTSLQQDLDMWKGSA